MRNEPLHSDRWSVFGVGVGVGVGDSLVFGISLRLVRFPSAKWPRDRRSSLVANADLQLEYKNFFP